MSRVLFYCQHLEGIGHLARSVQLVNELSRDFHVTLLQGGATAPFKPRPAVRVVQLPPLWMREGKLADPQASRPVAEIFGEREKIWRSVARDPFDAVIVELFPFGRKKFTAEILGLIHCLKAANPAIRVISSVRDILVEKKVDRSEEMARVVAEYFDAVWVHTDPELVPFNFPTELLGPKMKYTGYVAGVPRRFARGKEPLVVVSAGGGFRGRELFLAAARSAAEFAHHRFHFVFGPHADYRAEVEAALRPGANAHFTGLVEDFEGLLARASLSLSMGGYNTSLNLLRARVPALIYPYGGDQEQGMRAEAFARKAYVGVIRELGNLPSLMRERMSAPYPGTLPDLNGAARSRALLTEMLG